MPRHSHPVTAIMSVIAVLALAMAGSCSTTGGSENDDGTPAAASAAPRTETRSAHASDSDAERPGGATAQAPSPPASRPAGPAPASADAPGAPDLRNATLPVPKGCIAGDGSATFSQGRAAALSSSGENTFVYIRHPVSVMDTASGPITLVPLECHAENKDLFHTVIAAYTSGPTLAGAQEMREVSSGAEAAIITALSVSGQSVHLDWVNQEAPGDQNCHLCSTGIGHLDLTWTGSGFSTSNFVIDH